MIERKTKRIKGAGGGSKVKFLRWTYVVALVMGSQELFTESKNLFPLLRYGLSKLKIEFLLLKWAKNPKN